MFDLFFGDDLRLAHRDHRLACRGPDEPPGTGWHRPEPLAGLDIHEGERVVALFGSRWDEQAGASSCLLRGLSDAPSPHDLVAVVMEDGQVCIEHVPPNCRRNSPIGRLPTRENGPGIETR